MDKLQKMFDASLLRGSFDRWAIVRKIVKKRFGDAGITLSEDQAEEITKRIRDLKDEESTIEVDDILAPGGGPTPDINLELTDADVEKVTDELTTALKEEYPSVVDEVAELLLKEMRRDAASEAAEYRKHRAAFEKRLEKTWGKPLRVLDLFLAVAFEAGAEFHQHYRQEAAKNNDLVFEALTRLHARACQIGSEVEVLLRAGFADGAHARWRTLHEVAVVALFISDHGQAVAERYLDHEAVESYKAANQYQIHCAAMGYKALTARELDKIKKRYDNLLQRHGTEFKNSYGWAAQAFGKKDPNFSDIEKSVGLEKWRSHYRLASHNVHANPKGITFRLGLSRKERGVLLAGVSDRGLADPGHGIAVALFQTTTTLLLTKPNLDAFIRCKVLSVLEKEVGEEFLKVHKRTESRRRI